MSGVLAELTAGRIPSPSALFAELDALSTQEPQVTNEELREGRVGPLIVGIDLPSISGELDICPQPIHLLGNGNFTSVRANACVFAKKWMYEVTLGSGGIQQLGWTTINTQWNTEEGVGDHSNSYSYDGSRVKKWNVQKSQYGKPWEKGDIVGCCVDLDEGTMSFHQNGESLGVAFRDIPRVDSRVTHSREAMAYFPAVSLSHNESCWINFGQDPFVYPVEGYRPLQPSDAHIVNHSKHRRFLAACIVKLTQIASKECDEALVLYSALLTAFVESACVQIDGRIVPQQCDEFLNAVVELHEANPDHVGALLRVLPLALDGQSLAPLMAFMTHRLCFRSSIVRPRTAWQPLPGAPHNVPPGRRRTVDPPPTGNPYLRCLAQFLTPEILQHWVQGASAVHLDILNLLSVKPPNPEEARELFPHVWWNGCLTDDGHDLSELQAELFFNRVKGFAAMVATEDALRTALLRRIATHAPETLSHLLDCSVRAMQASVRMFSSVGRGIHGDTVIRLFFGTLEYFNHLPEPTDSPCACPGAADGALRRPLLAAWPFPLLLTEDEESRDLQRFGGLLSYLKKDYPLRAVPVASESSSQATTEPMDLDEPLKANLNPSISDEVRLYHGLFMRLTQLYAIGIKDKINRASSVVTTKNRLAEKMAVLLKENRARAGDLREELHAHVRRCAWEYIVLFANVREEQVVSIASRAIRMFQFYEDSALFRYMPNYLIEVVANILQVLRKAGTQYVPLLTQNPEIVLFLLGHVQDERIVNPDVKELITSAVNGLMETDARRRAVVVTILKQPANRSCVDRFLCNVLTCFNDGHNWVGVIDIILKFYSGLGFGFVEEDDTDELDLDLFLDDRPPPCAAEHHVACSEFFCGELFRYCEAHHEAANEFVNSIFNHLNWSMTELAISLGEQRAGGSFLPGDINSTRKCSIMFEMCCKLLRILEMATDRLRHMFVKDPGTPLSPGARWSASPTIEDRLNVNVSLVAEVIAHALNRFTSGDGTQELERVIRLDTRALQGLKKARVLAPVAGLLVNMVLDGPNHTSRPDSLFLRNLSQNTDRKWGLEAVTFLRQMAWKEELAPNAAHKIVCNKLALLQSDTFMEALGSANAANDALRAQQLKDLETCALAEDDETMCPICCSRPTDRVFRPCEHRSCVECVTRHLLNCKKCFFCNAEIVSVEEVATVSSC